MKTKNKVVFDTNIFISALIFGGKPRVLLDQVLHGDLKLYCSPEILSEIRGVLVGPKFQYSPAIALTIERELLSIAEIVCPETKIKLIKTDPADNRILECALAAQADFIISGDQHLLALDEFRGIPIVTVNDFLQKF